MYMCYCLARFDFQWDGSTLQRLMPLINPLSRPTKARLDFQWVRFVSELQAWINRFGVLDINGGLKKAGRGRACGRVKEIESLFWVIFSLFRFYPQLGFYCFPWMVECKRSPACTAAMLTGSIKEISCAMYWAFFQTRPSFPTFLMEGVTFDVYPPSLFT